jgi:hypothetical protein
VAADVAAPEELYGLPPEEFVAARNALVKRLRAGGDRPAAATVAKLRRPTPAAWALDQVARLDPSRLEAALAAGARLRTATSAAVSGDPDAFRRASAEERAATDAAVEAAASHLGSPGPEVRARIAAILRAAFLDEEVADRLRRGVLDADLDASSSGFGFGFGDEPADLPAVTVAPAAPAEVEAPSPTVAEPAPEEAEVRPPPPAPPAAPVLDEPDEVPGTSADGARTLPASGSPTSKDTTGGRQRQSGALARVERPGHGSHDDPGGSEPSGEHAETEEHGGSAASSPAARRQQIKLEARAERLAKRAERLAAEATAAEAVARRARSAADEAGRAASEAAAAAGDGGAR